MSRFQSLRYTHFYTIGLVGLTTTFLWGLACVWGYAQVVPSQGVNSLRFREEGTMGEKERVLSNSELIWAQIETAFSADFARELNLPVPDIPSLAAVQQSLQQVATAQGIKPALMYVRTKETHVELVLVKGEGPPVYIPVPVAAAEVRSVVEQFHRTITNPVLRPAQYLPLAQQLFEWFMAPMLQELKQANIDHIGFILDTGLRSVPMAALHSGERFLIEDYSIGLLPTAGLSDLNVSPLKIVSAPSATLAMGVASFEKAADLMAVPLELDWASQGYHDEKYLDQEATFANLHRRLSEGHFTSVHLATHATFQPGSIGYSHVQLWDQSVSLEQLQELPLDAVDFLILSACTTVLGDPSAELGFAGLALNIGVKTVLASLWSINDEATLGLMSEFYRGYGHRTRAQALRQAQVALLRGSVGIVDGTVYGDGNRVVGHLPSLETSGSWNFSHPAYWSSFTMIGYPW